MRSPRTNRSKTYFFCRVISLIAFPMLNVPSELVRPPRLASEMLMGPRTMGFAEAMRESARVTRVALQNILDIGGADEGEIYRRLKATARGKGTLGPKDAHSGKRLYTFSPSMVQCAYHGEGNVGVCGACNMSTENHCGHLRRIPSKYRSMDPWSCQGNGWAGFVYTTNLLPK